MSQLNKTEVVSRTFYEQSSTKDIGGRLPKRISSSYLVVDMVLQLIMYFIEHKCARLPMVFCKKKQYCLTDTHKAIVAFSQFLKHEQIKRCYRFNRKSGS